MNQEVGIEIAEQISKLIESQADGPYGRGAAKPGQDQFGQDGLYLEKKKSAQKDGSGINPRGRSRRGRSVRGTWSGLFCAVGEHEGLAVYLVTAG